MIKKKKESEKQNELKENETKNIATKRSKNSKETVKRAKTLIPNIE